MEPEAYYLMNKNEQTFWWYVGMFKMIDTQLQRFIGKDKKNTILDAGCGTGAMFRVLSKYGIVYAIDQSKEAIKYASSKNIAKEIRLGSITKLPYKDNSFDIVVCLDVLYHEKAGNDLDALKEFYRVLRLGGRLIVREPAYNWLRGHQDAVVWTKKRYSKKELQSKISIAGFAIKKKSYINFFLFPLALAKRLTENFYNQKDISKSTFQNNSTLNYIFTKILFLESKLINYMNFPFGLSIMFIGKKK